MIASTVRSYLRQQGIHYTVVQHPKTFTAMQTAAAAHVPGDRLAKSVVLADDDGPVVAVVPSTHRIDIEFVDKLLGRDLDLASEDEVSVLFDDCERGAIPPLGPAYGVATLVDDSLTHEPDIYFEAGDHTELVHVSGHEFRKLMGQARAGRFSHHI